MTSKISVPIVAAVVLGTVAGLSAQEPGSPFALPRPAAPPPIPAGSIPESEAAPPPPISPYPASPAEDTRSRLPQPLPVEPSLPPLPRELPPLAATPSVPPATAVEFFFLPRPRTIVARTTAERLAEWQRREAWRHAQAMVTAPGPLGPVPDRPPLLPHLVPDVAHWLDYSSYVQRPSPGSRPEISLAVDRVNAWGGRVQDSAESWTTWLAQSVPGFTVR